METRCTCVLSSYCCYYCCRVYAVRLSVSLCSLYTCTCAVCIHVPYIYHYMSQIRRLSSRDCACAHEEALTELKSRDVYLTNLIPSKYAITRTQTGQPQHHSNFHHLINISINVTQILHAGEWHFNNNYHQFPRPKCR